MSARAKPAGARSVLVALGANLGDPHAAVAAACAQLQPFAASGFRASACYRSAPVDCPPGSPVFINAAVAFEAGEAETPASLLLALQAIEAAFGRAAQRARNSPRPLDLDLILFGQRECTDAWLTLPHPRAHLRRFVLEPAAEIAADWPWPGRNATVLELLLQCRAAQARGDAAAESIERLPR
jgi:2-amino-4-hydroxy-6-hydroxymethyldihydropteridine diphosphokinase